MPFACETDEGIFGIGMTTREAREYASEGTGEDCSQWRCAAMTAGAYDYVLRHGFCVAGGEKALARTRDGWFLATEVES